MKPVSLGRAVAAEAVGTALLLAAVVGSGIMAERLSGGSVGLALLANTGATVAALVALILAFGPISGAHFNPVVTLTAVLADRLSPMRGGIFVVAQLAGAIMGVWLAHLMFDLPLLQTSAKVRTGLGQWVAEAVATFTLVLTIRLVGRSRPDAIPAAVGAVIGAAYWFTASTSFANPAVTIARALTDSFAGIRPDHVAAFILAQVSGGLLALGFAQWLHAPMTERTRKTTAMPLGDAKPIARPETAR